MDFTRLDNGHHLCNRTNIEFMSTWAFGRKHHVSLSDLKVKATAVSDGVDHPFKCPIEFASARVIWGNFVYMYPVDWLMSRHIQE